MWAWVRRLTRRYPPPRKALARPTPIARELPHTIRSAARVRDRAETLFDTDRSVEGTVFPGRRRREQP